MHIEIGRYSKPRKTPLNDRKCRQCNSGDIEDEEHFILFCNQYSEERNNLFTKLNSFTTFNTLTSEQQFQFIMSYNGGDVEILKHILEFVNKSIGKRMN